jgi:two-component sensor histidine kinase
MIMTPSLADAVSKTKPAIDPRDAADEANHRIANNLAAVAAYVRSELFSLSREKTVDYRSISRSLQQLSLRIDAIGRLHRLLTNSAEANVEICAYLREIADAAHCSLARTQPTTILFLFDTETLVTAKQAAAIGAIVSEAIVNSIKYSHPDGKPGVIKIGCKRRRGDGLVVEVKDDGIGRRPREFAGERYRASGIGLMQTLAHGLAADLEIIDGKPGYTVRFEVPLSDGLPQ